MKVEDYMLIYRIVEKENLAHLVIRLCGDCGGDCGLHADLQDCVEREVGVVVGVE